MKKLLFAVLLLSFHTLLFAPNLKLEERKQNITQCNLFENISNIISNTHINTNVERLPIVSPVDTSSYRFISDDFGYRKHPILLLKMFHEGIDIACPIGTNIFSTGKGYIEKIGYEKHGYGNYIIVNHLNGYKTRYAHLKHINVKERQVVTQGMTIATSGNTGRTTGSHLHYEIIKNNKVIDPIKFITNNKLEYFSTLKNIQRRLPLYRATI